MTLGHVGSLEVFLTHNLKKLRQAQKLRYRVFYEEMSAIADSHTQFTRRDQDEFDPLCDHLIVVDNDHLVKSRPFSKAQPEIVGTYRLLQQDVAELNGGFYTAGEYDIQPLIDRHANLRFMELGRSCVIKPYRNKRTLELLWHGIWSYVLMNNVDVMIGCASIEGTDPQRLKEQLSFLHHYCQPDDEWKVSALPEYYEEMNLLPKDEINPKTALRALPPLIKGYLRLGASIGSGAVVDHQFGTTDVLIIMPVSRLNQRHLNYYGDRAQRYAS
nr:GNAT family N-acetyltransferase [Pseudovibrio sp. M1P-2-3]